MANRNTRLITKQTSVPGRVPTGTTGDETSAIRQGELAINTSDKKLFSFNGSEVFEVGSDSFLNLTGGTVGSLNVTGDSVFTGSISANTIYSAGTDLYDIFLTSSPTGSTGESTNVQPGSNISTGGTPSTPIVSVVDSPVFDNIESSGSSSFNSLSALTYFSGSTPMEDVFEKKGESRTLFYRATSLDTSNLNTNSSINFPFNQQQINDDPGLFQTTATGVRFLREASIEIICRVTVVGISGNYQRFGTGVRFLFDGIPNGPQDYSMYIRASNGATEGVTELVYYFPNIAVGEELDVQLTKTSGNGTGVVQASLGDSYLIVKAYDRISGDAPVITFPTNNSTVSFLDGQASSFQALGINNASAWELDFSPSLSSVSVNASGLIEYDGTPGTFSETGFLKAVNGVGEDQISITIEVIPNPFFKTGYLGHWRAEDIQLPDGSTISQMDDITGNGNNISNTVTANQPTLVTPDSDGTSSVFFDGIDNSLGTVSGLFQASTLQTVFIVFSTVGGSGNLISVGTLGSDKAVINLSGTGPSASLNASLLGANPGPVTSSPIGSDIKVAVLYGNGAQTFLRVNGVAEGDALEATPGINIDEIVLGNSVSSSSFSEMYLKEAIVYSSALTLVEIQEIESFLINKYGL